MAASIARISFATVGFAIFLLVVALGYWSLPRSLPRRLRIQLGPTS